MKKVYVVGAALMSLASLKAGDISYVDVKVDVKADVVANSCVSKRGEVKCDAVIGTVGGTVGEFETVTVAIDPSAVTKLDLDKTGEVTLTPPAQGKWDIIEFTPKEGSLKGQKIYVATRVRPVEAGSLVTEPILDIMARLAGASSTRWKHAGEVKGSGESLWNVLHNGTWVRKTSDGKVTEISLDKPGFLVDKPVAA